VHCARRLAISPKRADHDADPSDHHRDLGDHDGDPGDHDAPILAITMGRSERSRSSEIRKLRDEVVPERRERGRSGGHGALLSTACTASKGELEGAAS
jgi:hypothetical protein